MNEKIIGYTVLTIGIAIILFSGFNIYSVFTKHSKPVELFNFESIGIDSSQILSGILPPEARRQGEQQTQKTELISKDILNQTSNLFAHLMLMGFIANIGAKLANTGVLLLRPVVVNLKAKEVTT